MKVIYFTIFTFTFQCSSSFGPATPLFIASKTPHLKHLVMYLWILTTGDLWVTLIYHISEHTNNLEF